MKLLFEQNLSPKLAGFFAELFAESKHLQDLNLDIANDSIVWEFAKNLDSQRQLLYKRYQKPTHFQY